MVLSTGVLYTDARAKEDERGIVVSADGRIMFVVPFDIVDPLRLGYSSGRRLTRR